MIFGVYLLMINMLAFFTMGWDKARARRSQRRVPEKRLFALAVIGGSLGIFIGMRVFRHKTQHASFVNGIPAIIALQVGLYFWWSHQSGQVWPGIPAA